MTEPFRMLFGVDESEFSAESLAAAGRLIARNQGASMTIFHGAPDLRNMLAGLAHLDDDSVEECVKTLHSESRINLEKVKNFLIDEGIDKERISAVLDENCSDPAGTMLDLAAKESFDVVGLARLGTGTVGRHVIGSVSYRVACSSEKIPVWVVDHRVRSRNCLICLVGAPIGERVLDHAVKHFSHLNESRFTLFHVIPPLSLEADHVTGFLSQSSSDEGRRQLLDNFNLRVKNAERVLEEGKSKLIAAGIPEKNINLKKKMQEKGIARDILTELESGDNGILVVGRKGSKDIKEFGLGSKAYKLLCAARAFTVCLVN